jgi:hypothetical protein
MWETCALELRVELPRPIALALEEVQRSQPEVVSRILTYGFTRQLFFEELGGPSQRRHG